MNVQNFCSHKNWSPKKVVHCWRASFVCCNLLDWSVFILSISLQLSLSNLHRVISYCLYLYVIFVNDNLSVVLEWLSSTAKDIYRFSHQPLHITTDKVACFSIPESFYHIGALLTLLLPASSFLIISSISIKIGLLANFSKEQAKCAFVVC